MLLTATGVLTEIQSALNAIWRAAPSAGISELVRARLVSLGLVATLGFLMLVSLAVSAGLTALGSYLSDLFPGGSFLMSLLNSTISLVLISALFAAIYKILPDKPIAWRDVAVGSVVTAVLFTIGKSLIGLYIGSSLLYVLLFWWKMVRYFYEQRPDHYRNRYPHSGAGRRGRRARRNPFCRVFHRQYPQSQHESCLRPGGLRFLPLVRGERAEAS